MKLSQFFVATQKETPKDAELISHKFLLRAGFIKQYTAGVYGYMPLGLRVLEKIEAICREEMNQVGSIELKLPCLSPRELWEETGRYEKFGPALLRLQDRSKKDLVLNPTHEEPVIHMAKSVLKSYKDLPRSVYQIQTKYRDEPRPRGGVIRLREFLMKDAYSFHETEECLKSFYDKMHEAYMKFYRRTGCRNFFSVRSDNGVFGGDFSHEFQLLTPMGEDKLLVCPACSYKANIEVAKTNWPISHETAEPLESVETPHMKTILSLCQGLNIPQAKTAKAVLFQTEEKKPRAVAVFLRGDLNVNEPKLQTLLKVALVPAREDIIQDACFVPGSIGPKGLSLEKMLVVIDDSIEHEVNLVTGENKDGYHYKGFSTKRDFLETIPSHLKSRVFVSDIAQVPAGSSCPECLNGMLEEKKGIEIGNIFHLGQWFPRATELSVTDNKGQKKYPIMGCYGIGITRLMGALIEEHHDDFGPIFPISVSPFDVHICVLKSGKEDEADKEVIAFSEKIYQTLMYQKVDVLMDDRGEKPGSQFADADLFGIPIRLVISKKTVEQGGFELRFRDKRTEPQLRNSAEEVVQIVKEEHEKYRF